MQQRARRPRGPSPRAAWSLLLATAALLALGGYFLADRSATETSSPTSPTASTPPPTANPPGDGTPTPLRASVETEPVSHSGDAADDPAIWVNRLDPSRSAILGTDKQGALLVYDLAGRVLQSLPVGDVNNVDVRSDLGTGTAFDLGGRPISLVTAGNRSDNTILVYEMVPETRRLRNVSAQAITPGIQVYGSCMYQSAATDKTYVFITSKLGEVEQWELLDNGAGKVDAALVRTIKVSTTETEGCVADDDLGFFYVSDEDNGIWKYGAEPADGSSRTSVARTSATGPLVADIEGLALAREADGTGLLIASSQGNSTYAVFQRAGDNDFVGSFRIVAAAGSGIDGTEDTDGIDVSTADLGPAFPSGVFIAQDGANGNSNQNFKLVPYPLVAALAGAA